MTKKTIIYPFLFSLFCFLIAPALHSTKAMPKQGTSMHSTIYYPFNADEWPPKPIFPYGWPDLPLPLTSFGEKQEIIATLYSSSHTKSSQLTPVPEELRHCIQTKYSMPPSFIHILHDATGRFMDRAFQSNTFNKAQRIDHYIVTQRQSFANCPYSSYLDVEILVFEFNKPEMIGKLISLHTHNGIFYPKGYIPNKGPSYSYELQITENTAYYIISHGSAPADKLEGKKNTWLHLDMTNPNPVYYWGEETWYAARDIIWNCMLRRTPKN